MKRGADRPERGRLREEARNRKESAGGGGTKKLPVPVGGAGSVIDGGERSVEKASANGGATGR